jgi:hypothetical protein
MDPLVAELTLAEIGAAQRRNRRRAAAVRFPLAMSGICIVLSAGCALVLGRDHLAVFFGPTIVLTALAAGRHYRRSSIDDGVQTRIAPWALTALALLALCATTSRLGAEHHLDWVNVAGPSLVFAAGWLLLATWGGNRPLIFASAIMIADSLIAPLIVQGDAGVAWQCGVDGALLVVAAIFTSLDQQPT